MVNRRTTGRKSSCSQLRSTRNLHQMGDEKVDRVASIRIFKSDSSIVESSLLPAPCLINLMPARCTDVRSNYAHECLLPNSRLAVPCHALSMFLAVMQGYLQLRLMQFQPISVLDRSRVISCCCSFVRPVFVPGHSYGCRPVSHCQRILCLSIWRLMLAKHTIMGQGLTYIRTL
jgi:hypothetical protein